MDTPMSLLDTVLPGPTNKVELLIDADYLAYMVGSLSQSRDNDPNRDMTFVCLDEEQDEWRWVEPPDLVDWKVRNELDKLFARFDTNQYRIYLTGEGNFREEVAVTKPYKGTRVALKPYYWQRVRDLLVNEYQAEIIEGWEADDEVSIQQMQSPHTTVVVSNDKDLRNTPGYLYIPRTDELLRVHPCYAEYHFWKQMVTGDTVDNIPGIPRRGEKFFDSLVEKHSAEGCFAFVVDDIQDEYDKKDASGNLFDEQFDLLYMLRRPYKGASQYAASWTEDAPGVDDVELDAIHLYGPYNLEVNDEHTSD